MRRGEIRPVDLGTPIGAEAAERRPAVVVSNDGANLAAARLGRGVVTIVPLTTNVSRVFPFQALLPVSETGLAEDSKAQAEQVRSVSVDRLGPVIGFVPAGSMAAVEEALRLHLAL